MSKSTFSQQAAAITEAVSHCENVMHEPELQWLKQASITLGAMSPMEDLIRQAFRLGLAEPLVVEIFRRFPEASFSENWTRKFVEQAKGLLDEPAE